jgi:hypothetical protein
MDPEISGAWQLFVLLDMKNKNIFSKLQTVYGDGCVSYAWGEKWAEAFREGRTSLVDDSQSGRSLIPNAIERVLAKAECEPCQSGSAMARDLGLSKSYALEVLKKIL